MALEVTPTYRNLRTRVTFLGLEAEATVPWTRPNLECPQM